MKSIKNTITNEIVIEKSRFITMLFNVSTVDDAKAILADVKSHHPSANHHCYAYVIGDHFEYQKQNDDGEPSGTAGMPILDSIKRNELTNILCIVIRYFGGIKLGAGGLIRAYSKSASEAIRLATFTYLNKFVNVSIRTDYSHYGAIERFISDHNYEVKNSIFTDIISLDLLLLESEYEKFAQSLINITKNTIEIKKGVIQDTYL